jgi:hypothetical protein
MEKEFLVRIVNAWGEDKQIDMMIEEMSELTQALLKLRRAKAKKDEELVFKMVDHVCEEIVDVSLMLEQMDVIFPTLPLIKWREYKIKKIEEKLKKHESPK